MPIDVTFTLLDDYSRKSLKGYEGVATILSDAVTHAAGLLADLAGVSLMGCYKSTFNIAQAESEAVETGANVDAGGTIHVLMNNGKQGTLKIPAIDPALVNPDGSIDLTAQAIIDFVANFLVGGNYRLSEGNYVTQVLYGELDR